MKPLQGQLLGYPVSISVYFCASLCMLLLADRSGILCWCIFAAVAHEMGHLLAMRILQWPPCEIRFTVFGLRLFRRSLRPVSYGSECLASLAGPCVNLLIGMLLQSRWIAAPNTAVAAQFVLGAFNLLPIEPLDGGQVLCALCSRFSTPLVADRICTAVTLLFLFPLMTVLFGFTLRGCWNISLWVTAIYLVIFFVRKHY